MADLLDVISRDLAYEALPGLKGSANANRIDGLVTAVSRRLDQACGPIVARLVTETFRGESGGTLFLEGKPFAATPPVAPIVSESWSNEAAVTVLAADYLIEDDGSAGRLTRWAGYWRSRVTVTYTAGRYATTAAVQEPFVTAAGMLLQHLWRPANGGGSETYGLAPGFLATGIPSFGFPNSVRDLLAGELLPMAVA